MEFWPADFRPDSTTSTQKGRKGKVAYRLKERSIVSGTLGAAALTTGKVPQWIHVVQEKSRSLPWPVGKSVEVFPPTKPPPVTVPRLTTHRRAEQGARFLRTYYPDVDVSYELLKDELESDEEEAAVDSVLNPYAGNRLAHLVMETSREQLSHFLAFPCGETGSELNVSPFRLAKDKGLLFTPSTTPALTFDTPIQQIAAFLPKMATSQKLSLIAIRTHSLVSVVKLQHDADSHEGSHAIMAKAVIPISVSETGNRRIVDVSCGLFSSSDAQTLLVNDMGAVFNCGIQGENKVLSIAPDVPMGDNFELDHFWRLAWRGPNACIRASGKKVHLFDLRARTALPQELFHVTNTLEYLTSLEAPSGGGHPMTFATSSKLLWFDDRSLKRPVLSLKHQRAFDRSLRLQSVKVGSSLLTVLSSTANHLVTVYDVNYASSGHIQLHGEPSLLPASSSLNLPTAGSLLFRCPDDENQFSHFQLSSRGSLWKTNLRFSPEPPGQTPADTPDDFEWSEDVQALSTKANCMTEEIGSLGGKEYVDANLRGIYEKIFDVQGDAAEEDAEVVYQTLEKMPFFWQDMSGSTEYMLISFDVAFQCGPKPLHATRADFLTQTLLSSARGFAALIRGRVPIPRLVSTVRWYHDISSLPPVMVPNVRVPSHILIDQLREEASAHATTPQALKRATEAAQHLVLDLALSRHAYAPQPFPGKRVDARDELDGPDVLSEATKAMSLGATEPPPVQFGFLRPIIGVRQEDDNEKMDGDDGLREGEGLGIPLGVRLLLSQWEVGSNPEDYTYKDPYEERDASPATQTTTLGRRVTHGKPQMRESTQHGSVPVVVSAPRPPLVVPSASRRGLTGSRPLARTASMLGARVISGSSPVRQTPSSFPADEVFRGTQRHPQTDYVSFSQNLQGPSSQPLPGPFGGGSRQLGGAKKKSLKKRMGGF